ncbi:unnamed protein product [Clonostachys chloroleuca]|uniref:Transcription factor domain-containing protein n=1 Tax=Clonostachys chloroleuca TaxID=1926264 RepID=A0AA35PY63_9HYPO|nr:unnamed protein product [Clonostachys chloroleuca]
MTSNSLPPSPASLSIEHHSTISASPKNTKLYGQPLQPAQPKYDDIISRGILKESEGRKLFQLYMANANVFLPFFDSTVDTFDALRHRSTFCFTVVLAIALRADRPRTDSVSKNCFEEAQRLAARSLFAISTQLETVQGMILLSAHAERNWFAISHAYQMGKALQLPDLLPREDETEDTQDLHSKQFSDRRSNRRIRTALILHQVEQEVAGGTARQSIGNAVKSSFLESFLGGALSCTRDMRIVANIEVVQLRGRLLKELELHDSLDGTVKTMVSHIENEINTWFNRWDSVFQDQDYSVSSFQRSSIRLQRDYAFIIICSALISKLSEGNTEKIHHGSMTDEVKDLIEVTLMRSIKILSFITDGNDYKWYLQWAPTYSALFPAFTAALAFRLAKLLSGFSDWEKLLSSFLSVADVLGDYPHQTYCTIILNLARLTASSMKTDTSPTSSSVVQAVDNSQAQIKAWSEAATSEHAQTESHALTDGESSSHLTSQCDVPADDFGWSSGPISQCDFPEGSAAAGGDQLDMYASFGMPDNSFDFSLFAASVQDYMDVDDSVNI